MSAYLANLPQGFALVPLTESLHDEIVAAVQPTALDSFPQFERLSASVETAVREATAVGPLGYIETDYFGGSGTQCAVAWTNAARLVGPFRTESGWDGSDYTVRPPGEWAINQVLVALGVKPVGENDAFDTLGLGQYRVTESVEQDAD